MEAENIMSIISVIQNIRKEAYQEEQEIRKALYANAKFSKSYYDLYTTVRKLSATTEDFNYSMSVCRPLFLDARK